MMRMHLVKSRESQPCEKTDPVRWIGSALDDLREFPPEVQGEVGFALHHVQMGQTPFQAKPLKGFGGVSVMEIVSDFQTNAYRAVYTAKFAGLVYVLHCFQKKSKRGIATAQQDIALIRRRFKDAQADFARLQERELQEAKKQ